METIETHRFKIKGKGKERVLDVFFRNSWEELQTDRLGSYTFVAFLLKTFLS